MIDTAKITISGGNGGDGLITFAKGKFKPKGPPMGGSGGRGGTVYLIADNNTATLKDFTTAKLLKAENGGSGGSNDKTGKCGEDLFIKVPIGTTVTDELNTVIADLDKNGKVFLVAKGGNGGRGNAHMAKDLSPRRKEGIKESVDAITTNLMGYSGKRFSKEKHIYYAEKGSAGEIKQIKLELKLIADVGLIGLPNAGKSSLLNSLTKTTKAPVGSYPFTTLEPNLGVLLDPNSQSGCVIADIPGLIEGAHEGKGLGGKFLKHVERTKLLVHIISIENLEGDEKSITKTNAYKTIRDELYKWNLGLIEKPEIIVVNKIDMLNKDNAMRKCLKNVIFTSAVTNEGVDELKGKIIKETIKQKEKEEAKEKSKKPPTLTFTIQNLPNKKMVFK